jgi:hypothetical protein
MVELTRAVEASAITLAELHSRPDGSGGPVNAGFLRFNHRLAERETAAVAAAHAESSPRWVSTLAS